MFYMDYSALRRVLFFPLTMPLLPLTVTGPEKTMGSGE